MSGGLSWDDPRTVAFYEGFSDAHPRYHAANEALVAAAGLPAAPRLRVLDIAAGTGRTAELALPCRLTCFEPSVAMRAIGARRIPHARWISSLDCLRYELFDRILCGASIWQMLPIENAIARLTSLLAPGGRLVFNIPSMYLGISEPQGGSSADPYLSEIWSHLPPPTATESGSAEPLLNAESITRTLQDLGLRVSEWQSRSRLTLAEYRDWLKIPVLTNHIFPDLDPDARAMRLDEAYARCSDPQAWRWETWSGWTATRESGSFLACGILDTETLGPLCEAAESICRARGWLDEDGLCRHAGLAPCDPEILAAQAELQIQPVFETLRRHPALRSQVESLADAPVRDRQGDVWRIVFPNRPDLTTRPHRDDTYLGEGRNVWIAWIPLTACPVELGPLAIRDADAENWRPQPMSEGDVLFFHASTWHRALDNLAGDRLRLSVDLRFEVL